MTKKFICIHAHFYQPPRENPWLEEVEVEESAAPFHDWNERISYECYAPNTSARILGREGRIERITSNYEKISFNFGPTLLSWMERRYPEPYEKILEADRRSVKERGGHGNAIAQVYNHSIMPLNSARDKETQIVWGIRDFEYRFGRSPEGIWFAEAAVDSESLSLAAKHGIKFTVLSPRQAKSVRPLKGSKEWLQLNGDVDSTRPYLFRPGGKDEMAIFFYDGAMSQAIAFEGALFDGVKMGQRLLSRFKPEDERQLVHIATDGESYGHHHKFGDMALASAIATIEKQPDVKLTNYGQYLAEQPPDMEVEIVENSSWSCSHGVERWQSDCGCSTGSEAGWTQKWRTPLRKALNYLKTRVDASFEEGAGKYLRSPWEARNDYVELVLNRGNMRVESFFKRHQSRPLNKAEITEAIKYLEMQKMAMRMFTSCGWFFNDVSGLETVQILKYAAKAMDLAAELSRQEMEGGFLEILKDAKSNIKKFGAGADIYKLQVLPLRLDPMRIAAHTIILRSLWQGDEPMSRIYCFKVEMVETVKESYLDTMMMVGVLELTSLITLESKKLTFCMLHLRELDFNCFLHPFYETTDYTVTRTDIVETFRRRSIPELIHSVERHFGQSYFTIKAIFNDERRKAMERLMSDRINQFASAYNDLFENNRQLMDFHADINVHVPDEFKIAARYVFERQLGSLFTDMQIASDYAKMVRVFNEAAKWAIPLKPKALQKNLAAYMEYHLDRLCADGAGPSANMVMECLKYAKANNIEIDIRKMQNVLYPHYKAFIDPTHPEHIHTASTKEFKEIFESFDFLMPPADPARPV